MLNTHLPFPAVVALSGGADSVCLAYLYEQRKYPFRCVHVVHKGDKSTPRPGDSLHFVTELALARKWLLSVIEVAVCPDLAREKGWEHASSTARLAALSDNTAPGETLCFGHHADDQAETLLFRLFRGTGVAGLAGIQPSGLRQSVAVARPLLHHTRATIEQVLSGAGIPWFTDESNTDLHFSRNYIRHVVLPCIKAKFPQVVQKLESLSLHAGETKDLLADLAEQDLGVVCDTAVFSVARFTALSRLRQKNVLRHYMQVQSGLPPTSNQLSEVLKRIGTPGSVNIGVWALHSTSSSFSINRLGTEELPR